MALDSLLTGIARGLDQKLQLDQQQAEKKEMRDLQLKMLKRKLEQEDAAQEQLQAFLSELTVGDESESFGDDPGNQQARNLSDLLVDPELQALGLRAGAFTVPQLLSAQGAQQGRNIKAAEAAEAAAAREQERVIFERFFPAFGGSGGGKLPPGSTLSFKGPGGATFSIKGPDEEDVAMQQRLDEAAQGVIRSFERLKVDKGKPLTPENMDDAVASGLVFGFGEGELIKQDILTSATLAFRIGGKALTEGEEKKLLGNIMPGLADLRGAFSSQGPVAGVKASIISKLERLQRLLAGQLSPEQQKVMLAEIEKQAGFAEGSLSLEQKSDASIGNSLDTKINQLLDEAFFPADVPNPGLTAQGRSPADLPNPGLTARGRSPANLPNPGVIPARRR